MSDTMTALNQFCIGYFQQLDGGIPEEHYQTRPHGQGNSPLWIAGHLAFCVELGEMLLGEALGHPEWMPVFGPGSPADVVNSGSYDRCELTTIIVEGYPRLLERIQQADSSVLEEPHGVELLKSTPLKTKSDLLAHLVTTHFTFHLAQLSACRRALGGQPLF